MVDRLCKEHNDGHPQWQVAGGDVRPARFEYLDEKVASCGLTARRNHGTQTGPENGAPANESCRGMYAAGANKSAFWKAHIQHPQLPEYCDFYESVGHSAPVPIDIEDLQNLENREDWRLRRLPDPLAKYFSAHCSRNGFAFP